MKKIALMMKSFFIAVVLLNVTVSPLSVTDAQAVDINIPSYVGSENLESDIQEKGEKITKIVILIAVVVIVICLAITGGLAAAGKREAAMSMGIGSLIGLVVLSLVGGIVSLILG